MHNKYHLLSTYVFIDTDTYELNYKLIELKINGREKK